MRQLFEKRLTSEGVRAFMRFPQDEVWLVAEPEWFDTDEFIDVWVELTKADINMRISKCSSYEDQLRRVDYALYTEEVIV